MKKTLKNKTARGGALSQRDNGAMDGLARAPRELCVDDKLPESHENGVSFDNWRLQDRISRLRATPQSDKEEHEEPGLRQGKLVQLITEKRSAKREQGKGSVSNNRARP